MSAKTLLQAEIRNFFLKQKNFPEDPKTYQAIHRALLVIQKNQEPAEVASEDVKYVNGRGWCTYDVKYANQLLKQINDVHFLFRFQIVEACEMLSHYSRQLAEFKLGKQQPELKVT